MDFKLHFERGWQVGTKFIGPVILLTLVQLVVSFLSLGLMAPVTMAGYMQSLLRAVREDRTPEVGDLFSHMSLFLPLFLFGLVLIVASLIGLMFFILPGLVLGLFVTFSCLYMLPLMTDKKKPIIEAIQGSWEMAKRDPISDQFIITLIAVVIYFIGGSVPLGIILAQPLATLIVLSVYEERLSGAPVQATPPTIEKDNGAVPPPPPPEPPQQGE